MVDRNEIAVLYTLFFFICSVCFVFKTDLFVGIGLTVEKLFENYLGSEHDNFVIYHIRRICITKVLHLSIPFGFFSGFILITSLPRHSFAAEIFSHVVFLITFSVPLYHLYSYLLQYQRGWNTNKVAQKLLVFSAANVNSWRVVASDVNSDFRNLHKVILHCGNRFRFIITRNWLIKVSAYDVDFAPQNDARLVVCGADTHAVGINGVPDAIQYISVKVIFHGERKEFDVRLRALDFTDLKDAVRCPIVVSDNVKFYQNKVDQFLAVFKDLVKKNPPYYFNEERENCIGCMATEANVKLVKYCAGSPPDVGFYEGSKCVVCNCRPLWCIDCMGKWFASRQDQKSTDTWLSSKCPCPVCRATFCVVDVCPVVTKDS